MKSLNEIKFEIATTPAREGDVLYVDPKYKGPSAKELAGKLVVLLNRYADKFGTKWLVQPEDADGDIYALKEFIPPTFLSKPSIRELEKLKRKL